jgi:phosphate transport system permease protein
MILPISTLLIRDTLRSVPRDLWESGLALGATRWEVTRRVSLRYGARGITSAGLLGFSRAIGEAVAVSFLIGGFTGYPVNIYATSNTLSALIVENLDSAFGQPALLAALAEVGIFLTIITLAVNIVGRRLVAQFAIQDVAV